MTQVFIDREKIKETIQEFKDFDSEEVLNIAIAALAFLHTKRVATISLNSRGLHGSFYASEDFNSGEFFWPFIEDCENILSDKIDMVEGDNHSIPKLPPLNLSASSSNSSLSRKTSLPVIISDPIKSPEFCQTLPEPSLPSSSPAGFITTRPTVPSIHSATICSSLPELDSTSFHSRPHSAPLLLPSSSNVSSGATNHCKDIQNKFELDLVECTVKREACVNLNSTLENQANFPHKDKAQKAVVELKQSLLSPASTPSNNLSQIQQNFKPGKPIIRKRSQGFDSIANSIFLIEKLASNSTLRSLAVFHYINIGKKFYELIGEQKENKHAASLFYQSVHSSLKHLRPSFDADFAVSNQHILKLCGRGKFLFKIYDVIGSSLSSAVIQHQIPLIKLTDSPKEERISLINWALTNKEKILSLPGFLTSSELERLENIAYDPQPSTPNVTLKGKSSKPDSSLEDTKLSFPRKRRIATPINARLSVVGSSTKSAVKKKRRT